MIEVDEARDVTWLRDCECPGSDSSTELAEDFDASGVVEECVIVETTVVPEIVHVVTSIVWTTVTVTGTRDVVVVWPVVIVVSEDDVVVVVST